MRLAELLLSEPDPTLWRLVKQCGVDDAVLIMGGAEQEARMKGAVGEVASAPSGPDAPWGEAALRAQQERLAEYGFRLAVIEDTAPMDRVRLGLPGRDEQIENVLDQVRAMGRLGIPTLCYNWMAVSSWARTDKAVPLRGGATSTGFSLAASTTLAPLVEPGSVTPAQLWNALAYFLAAAVPVAEEAGVRLALHPDDPPLPMVRSMPRIITSPTAYHRVYDLQPSVANAVTLCQGNFALMTNDLPAVIRDLGGLGRVAFVHFRDVRGTAVDFIETFHDDGQNDLAECMRAWAEVGFDGPLRPDHVPTLYGEDTAIPGYDTLGRLYALGYIRALQQVAYGRPAAR